MTDAITIAALPAGFAFREATADDIPEMVEVVNAAFEQEEFFVNGPRTNQEQLARDFRSGHFLLGHREARLAASVYYEVRGERGYIGMLAVRPDLQLHGLGGAIMHLAEQALRASGCRIAELSVVDVRTALPPLYRKLGYVESGLVEPPEELLQKLTMPVQLIRMEKQL